MPEIAESREGRGLKIGVAVAEFNGFVTVGLLEGALGALAAAGVEDPLVVRVAGSFELPVAARALVEAGCDAVVAPSASCVAMAIARSSVPSSRTLCRFRIWRMSPT